MQVQVPVPVDVPAPSQRPCPLHTAPVPRADTPGHGWHCGPKNSLLHSLQPRPRRLGGQQVPTALCVGERRSTASHGRSPRRTGPVRARHALTFTAAAPTAGQCALVGGAAGGAGRVIDRAWQRRGGPRIGAPPRTSQSLHEYCWLGQVEVSQHVSQCPWPKYLKQRSVKQQREPTRAAPVPATAHNTTTETRPAAAALPNRGTITWEQKHHELTLPASAGGLVGSRRQALVHMVQEHPVCGCRQRPSSSSLGRGVAMA